MCLKRFEVTKVRLKIKVFRTKDASTISAMCSSGSEFILQHCRKDGIVCVRNEHFFALKQGREFTSA